MHVSSRCVPKIHPPTNLCLCSVRAGRVAAGPGGGVFRDREGLKRGAQGAALRPRHTQRGGHVQKEEALGGQKTL